MLFRLCEGRRDEALKPLRELDALFGRERGSLVCLARVYNGMVARARAPGCKKPMTNTPAMRPLAAFNCLGVHFDSPNYTSYLRQIRRGQSMPL